MQTLWVFCFLFLNEMGNQCRVLSRVTTLLFERFFLTAVLKIDIGNMGRTRETRSKLLQYPGDTWIREIVIRNAWIFFIKIESGFLDIFDIYIERKSVVKMTVRLLA